MRIYSFLLCTSMATGVFASSHRQDTKVDSHCDFLLEWVYMLRSKGNNRKLVKDFYRPYCDGRCPSTVVLWADDLRDDFGFASGARVEFSYSPDSKSTYSSSLMYLLPWQAHKTVHGDASLSYPFHSSLFTVDYNTADWVKAYYKSHFYTADANYMRHSGKRGLDYFVISAVFGLRFFEITEKTRLAFYNEEFLGLFKSHYKTEASNDAIGAQGGFLFQMNPYNHFSFDLLALGGIGINKLSAYVQLKDINNTKILRRYHSYGHHDVVFANAEAQIGYRPASWFAFHAGYQLFYASGLAQSASQYSTSVNPQSRRFYKSDPYLIHGIIAGCNFDF